MMNSPQNTLFYLDFATIEARDTLCAEVSKRLDPDNSRLRQDPDFSLLGQQMVVRALELKPVDIVILTEDAKRDEDSDDFRKQQRSAELTNGIVQAREFQPSLVVLNSLNRITRNDISGDLNLELARGYSEIALRTGKTGPESIFLQRANENALVAIVKMTDQHDTEKLIEISKEAYLTDFVATKVKLALLSMSDYDQVRDDHDQSAEEIYQELKPGFTEIVSQPDFIKSDLDKKLFTQFIESTVESRLDHFEELLELIEKALDEDSIFNYAIKRLYEATMESAIFRGSKMLLDTEKTIERIKSPNTLNFYLLDLHAKYELNERLRGEAGEAPQAPFYVQALDVMDKVRLNTDRNSIYYGDDADFVNVVIEDIARHNDLDAFTRFTESDVRKFINAGYSQNILFEKLLSFGDIDVANEILFVIVKNLQNDLLIRFSQTASEMGRTDLCNNAFNLAGGKRLRAELHGILMDSKKDDVSGVVKSLEDRTVPALSRVKNYLTFRADNEAVDIPDSTIIKMIEQCDQKSKGALRPLMEVAKIGFIKESLAVVLAVFPKLNDEFRINALLVTRHSHPDWVEQMLLVSDAKTAKGYYEILESLGLSK